MLQQSLRNFVIIAHVDHGKSTLADRFLELTGTVPKRELREQFLDQMELERERGITIKMQPVRMLWHSDRGITQKSTQNDAEGDFLYNDLTYKIRGILFEVRKKLGLGHKEDVYHNALEIEFQKARISFESRKNITIRYKGKSIGTYQPDFIIENKVLVELKALPETGRPQIEQVWSYLKGSEYKLALLVNFGSKDLDIKRIVYDVVRKDSSALSALSLRNSAGVSNQIENEYILNLIDTPGHVDFSYEVSRALAAVEGAVLLVDGTQGIQAQTLAHLALAKKEGLTIIGAINKVDLEITDIAGLKEGIAQLLDSGPEEIFEVSGKTGKNVTDLLDEVCKKIPAPSGDLNATFRALIFDSVYDLFQGAIAYVRVVDGTLRHQQAVQLLASEFHTKAYDIGIFKPGRTPVEMLSAGEIGYITTGIKQHGAVRVGDTIAATTTLKINPLPGYQEPKPMVFAGFYPRDAKELAVLEDALQKLRLNDAALTFEPSRYEALGQGFLLGCLGTLHLEIVKERLKREYGIDPLITMPSVWYKVATNKGNVVDVFTPSDLPDPAMIKEIREPWVSLEILTPQEYMPNIVKLLRDNRGIAKSFETTRQIRTKIQAEMPLADMIVDFYDTLKSVSKGFASMSYQLLDWRPGDLVKLDIIIAGDKHDAFSRILPRVEAERVGRKIIEKLKDILPPEAFPVSIQAALGTRIIARVTLPASRKDVTGHLYGGDRTRKMKLWEKQKRGKARLRELGRVDIPASAFFEILKLRR